MLDLTGKTYGRLSVVGRIGSVDRNGHKDIHWECLCDCGNKWSGQGTKLTKGTTNSCGCLARELSSTRNSTHKSSKPHHNHNYLYKTWLGIKSRCYNKNDAGYVNYGGRNIFMYYEWIDDFELFKKWVLLNIGERQGSDSIDRIDNDGNYEPGNIRWASKSIQSRNRRSVKKVVQTTIDGQFIDSFETMTDASIKMGVQLSSISACVRGKTRTCKGFKWVEVA